MITQTRLKQTAESLQRNARAVTRLGKAALLVGRVYMRQSFTRKDNIPSLRHQTCEELRRIFNLKIKFNAAADPEPDKPRLYFANHISSMDIPALGSHLNCNFMADQELGKAPVLGRCLKSFGTMFVDKGGKNTDKWFDLRRNLTDLAKAFQCGEHVVVFGEAGIKTDGTSIAPFRAGMLGGLYDGTAKRLLNLPGHDEVTVQPVCIRVRDIEGRPVTSARESTSYSWQQDESMLAHAFKLAKCQSIGLEVKLLEPLKPEDFNDRRDLVAEAEHQVRKFHCYGRAPA